VVHHTVNDRRRPPDVLAGEQLRAAPSQERSRRARQSLLDAALATFAEHGFEATKVEEIAKRAGVAVGGFYLHFRSKRQVLLVLIDGLVHELEGRPATGRSDDPMTLFEQLRAAMQIGSYAGAYRAWREAALRDASLARLQAELEDWSSTRIAAVIETSAAPGRRATVDVAAFAWILSVLFWRSIEAPVANYRTVSDTIARSIMHTLFEDAVLPVMTDPVSLRPVQR
jgi:AcrR family transcriptional regulator